jgi:uncharacterized protein YbjQ (UPF0145 family)
MLPNINKDHAMLGHVAGDGQSYGSAKFAMQRKAYRLGANAVLGVMHNVDNKIENVSKSGTVRTKTTHYLQGTAIKYN